MTYPAWMDEGHCRNEDPELFFYPDGESGAARERRDEAAAEVCAFCPVRSECLEYALAGGTKTDYGFWGGASEADRRAMRRRQAKMKR